jgi:hypothetical protein
LAVARSRRFIIIAALLLLAAILRDHAVRHLPIDFDEPVYFTAGLTYTEAIRAGRLNQLDTLDPSPEHPGLVKLIYAAVFRRYPPAPPLPDNPAAPLPPTLREMGLAARRSSAVFGVLHVLLLALVSPAAGALLAVHSYTVKYTSQVYLEAVPMFTASVCVLAYMRARRSSRKEREGGKERQEESETLRLDLPWRPWREPLLFGAISAVALGLTAAGKYIYAVAGLAVAVDALWAIGQQRRPRGLLVLFGWGGLALLVFLAANPYLWPNPIGRLLDSLAFHAAYSQSAHVQQSGYPWYQPFVWLVAPLPLRWHPGAILVGLEPLVAFLGVIGIRPMWRAPGGRGRVVVLWWAIGLVFTLLWRTKWPQYSLVMIAPLALCAAEGLRLLWRRVPDDLRAILTSHE